MQLTQSSCEWPKRERQLGFYERFRVTLHDIGFYNNISIIARYSYNASFVGSLRHAIYDAFRHTIQEHPALGMAVTRDDSNTLYFQRLESVNLEEVIAFETIQCDEEEQERTLVAISARENNRGFKNTSEKPLWRAVVLQNGSGDSHNFHIAFIWHHLIGDGRSGLAVHKTILEGLSLSEKYLSCKTNGSSNGHNALHVPTSTKPMFISMEQALPHSSAPAPPNPPPKVIPGEKWAGGNYNFQKPIITQLTHIKLPAAQVKRVSDACHQKNTTMTALLQAIMSQAVFANVDSDRIRTAVAVSLRRFFSPTLNIDDDVMGLWISTYSTEYHRSQFDKEADSLSSLWKCSQRNTSQINAMIADGGKNVEIMSLMGIDDYEASLRPKMGQPRDNTFGLTNLGVYKPQKGGFAIDDMIFSQSTHANGAAFTICIVSVADGDMNVVFNWQKGIIEREKMEAIAEAVKGCLLVIGS